MLVQQPDIAEPLQATHQPNPPGPTHRSALALLAGLWLLLFFGSLFAPPLLDDADATHANAARHMALTGDWVTLHVNGIRYLEKAPLPYWLVALSFRLFGFNTFAAHLPQSLAVLFLALLGYRWASQAFDSRAAFYTGLGTLTALGVFLFTRIFIPEALLALFLAAALFCFLEALDRLSAFHAYSMWAALAAAVLTKGLVALVFFFAAATLYLILSGDLPRLKTLKPLTGPLLFLALAAPWHILAGLRNTGGIDGHGFFWFYFVNEHVLRFLGKRVPMDYNKLPAALYWSLHLVWLFPWALFLPSLATQAYAALHAHRRTCPAFFDYWPTWTAYGVAILGILVRNLFHIPYLLTVAAVSIVVLSIELRRRQSLAAPGTALLHIHTYAQRTTLLLTLFSALVLVFFAFSTNQEYYTYPAYLPLLMLLAHALMQDERTYSLSATSRRSILAAHAACTALGLAAAATLAYGLWTSRHFPFVPDIGSVLAHRAVGGYTLSMSHLFDLTGPSFAVLRLPTTLAALALAVGPAVAWFLRQQRRHLAATMAIALTSAAFLAAAHLALIRFTPMLSSRDFAQTVRQLERDGSIAPTHRLLLYGDQAFGSSIPFYLGENALLVEGRSTSMLFGSTFPDAPPIFLTRAGLLDRWGTGPRKLLFVPLEKREEVNRLLGQRQVLLQETSGKALLTDRPIDRLSDRPSTNDTTHLP